MNDLYEKIKTDSVKVLGFSTENKYNCMLKKINEILKPFSPIVIDGGFRMPSNTDAIIAVQHSIKTMNLNNLQKDDIVITNQPLLNHKIQESIFEILQPLLRRTFKNESIKNNFFTKHIVWLYERIQEVDFIKEKPVFLYYGETTEDDEIHLRILSKLGARIIFINPRMNGNCEFNKLLEAESFVLPNFAKPESFNNRIARAKEELIQENNVIQTVAKKAKEEFTENIYKNNNYVFKPWQFKNGLTVPIYIDAVIEDIQTYWEQDARFREGFEIKTENGIDKVYVPNFFTKINGVPFDKLFYKDLVNKTKNSQLTVFRENTELVTENFSKEEMFSLMFVMTYDKVDFEKIRQHKLYQLSRVNIDVQRFIINKYNEFSEKFKKSVQQIDLIKLLACIITCDTDFIKLIENFDFPFRVPKVVIYLKDRESFDLMNSLFIHYLNLIGMDIVIYSPTGTESIENNLFGNYLNSITMEEMVYDFSYDYLNSFEKVKKKKGFIEKIFG